MAAPQLSLSGSKRSFRLYKKSTLLSVILFTQLNMKHSIISKLLLSFLTSFTNGVWTAKLFCTSLSGRTTFEAELEDMQILQSAKFIVDDNELNFTYRDNGVIIFDLQNKIFTMKLESEPKGNYDTFRFVEFWAIPSTS